MYLHPHAPFGPPVRTLCKNLLGVKSDKMRQYRDSAVLLFVGEDLFSLAGILTLLYQPENPLSHFLAFTQAIYDDYQTAGVALSVSHFHA